jgi:tetratricopeptide (TPR) repeat protein
MYEAWEARTTKQAVSLAKRALLISPDCADAYNLLAEQTVQSIEEAIDLYTKGVEAGSRALGAEAFREDVGHFWGLLETRPYMRARAGLATALWAAGRRDEAVMHFQDMLRLNPNDNQGIRYMLLSELIELGRDSDAEVLFEKYSDDDFATWLYSRALLDFRRHGDGSIAQASLDAALEQNSFVPPYLLGRKKLPRTLPDYHGFGDETEAMLYAHENTPTWRSTPGSLEWLATRLPGIHVLRSVAKAKEE